MHPSPKPAAGPTAAHSLKDCPTCGLVYIEWGANPKCPECGLLLPATDPPHGTGWDDDFDGEGD